MEERIYLSPPHMTGNELKYINEAFQSNWIAPLGPNVDLFEKRMEEYLGEGFAVAMNSGTAAIHIALVLLGVKPNDLVLCSSFTFVASANPIKYLGAEPVFIDSEENSWNMCPASLDKAISKLTRENKKPKAIISVDLLGQPANYEKLEEISKKYDIPIIEDSAESLGASFKNKKCGTFGDFGIFSFNGNKIISTSGGGMLICKSKEMAAKAKHLITQARDNAPYYLHTEVGYNYRMSNVIAGLGIAQLESLDDKVEKRREVFEAYKKAFEKFPFIKLMPEIESGFSNRWLTSILLLETSPISPEEIIKELEKNNIEARHLWKPLHSQPLFSENKYFFNNESVCDDLFLKGVSLPSGSQLRNDQIDRIVSIIINLIKSAS